MKSGRDLVVILVLVAGLAWWTRSSPEPSAPPEPPRPGQTPAAPSLKLDCSLWQVTTDEGTFYLDIQRGGYVAPRLQKDPRPRPQALAAQGSELTFQGVLKGSVTLKGDGAEGRSEGGGPICMHLLASGYASDSSTIKTAYSYPADLSRLGGSLWLFRSSSWNGYIDFIDGERYWTHWGYGHYRRSGAKLVLTNDYDGFRHTLALDESGHCLRGERSDGVKEELLLVTLDYSKP